MTANCVRFLTAARDGDVATLGKLISGGTEVNADLVEARATRVVASSP